ncbi:hypothetical protein A20C1_09744 [marine actinobacterium PHSC20C1]|nr:hypothetical protein A20C1_09744 [marine actinobacterium PHSC20C1]
MFYAVDGATVVFGDESNSLTTILDARVAAAEF